MANEQEKVNPLLELLEGIIAAELPNLILKGESAISGLFHKHSNSIVGVVKTLDICPQGWHKDGHGICVPDVG